MITILLCQIHITVSSVNTDDLSDFGGEDGYDGNDINFNGENREVQPEWSQNFRTSKLMILHMNMDLFCQTPLMLPQQPQLTISTYFSNQRYLPKLEMTPTTMQHTEEMNVELKGKIQTMLIVHGMKQLLKSYELSLVSPF